MAQSLVCDLDSLNQGVAQKDITSPGKEVLESAIDDCLHQLSDLQLNKVPTFISNMNLFIWYTLNYLIGNDFSM